MSAKTRAELTAEIAQRTGIDDAMIDRLVRVFYERARDDALLGPVFSSRIADDAWEPHIERICAFWSSVALMTGVYHGQPMELHVGLAIDSRHFNRWLDLWAETARDICPQAAADHFIESAERIAKSLELGIAARRGIHLAPGERLPSSG